jgi:heterodisulfide reductase subunit A
MEKILIVGGGVAGCTAALSLAASDIPVHLIEKKEFIGGKTAAYGCKAGSSCAQCGVCQTGPLFTDLKGADGVEIDCGTTLKELIREEHGFRAVLDKNGETVTESVAQVMLTSGFSHVPTGANGNLKMTDSPALIYGEELEGLLKNRSTTGIFETKPEKIGFIFCFGSRNSSLGVPYCSKICCGYATRSAKALKYLYPDAQITMFYMDLQSVKAAHYLDEMKAAGFEMVRCRPSHISADGKQAVVRWEDTTGVHEKNLDVCVLCGGIRPGEDNELLAELPGIGQNSDGFLQTVLPPQETGIWVAGTAAGPMSIQDTVADARAKAACLIETVKGEVTP